MDITAVLNTLLHGNQLKRTPRTGWVQRGVPHAENVAAHSFGVVFVALVLAQLCEESLEEPLDLGRLLAIATLHDLPEALTTDIPTPAWQHLPPGSKTEVERGVMRQMLAETAFAPAFMNLWEELQAAETPEAKLVHDADKLELYLQAMIYEKQLGNTQLAEFWERPYRFHFPQAQAIYNAIAIRTRQK